MPQVIYQSLNSTSAMNPSPVALKDTVDTRRTRTTLSKKESEEAITNNIWRYQLNNDAARQKFMESELKKLLREDSKEFSGGRARLVNIQLPANVPWYSSYLLQGPFQQICEMASDDCLDAVIFDSNFYSQILSKFMQCSRHIQIPEADGEHAEENHQPDVFRPSVMVLGEVSALTSGLIPSSNVPFTDADVEYQVKTEEYNLQLGMCQRFTAHSVYPGDDFCVPVSSGPGYVTLKIEEIPIVFVHVPNEIAKHSSTKYIIEFYKNIFSECLQITGKLPGCVMGDTNQRRRIQTQTAINSLVDNKAEWDAFNIEKQAWITIPTSRGTAEGYHSKKGTNSVESKDFDIIVFDSSRFDALGWYFTRSVNIGTKEIYIYTDHLGLVLDIRAKVAPIEDVVMGK
jgi:hypothetical protein